MAEFIGPKQANVNGETDVLARRVETTIILATIPVVLLGEAVFSASHKLTTVVNLGAKAIFK